MTRTELAVEMIARGAMVFPLHPGLKTPLTSRGFKDAHNNIEWATTFLAHAGQPNYGVVWPPDDDPIFGLDLDGGDGYTDWRDDWKALTARLGALPRSLTTITPSGGRHVFHRWMTSLYGPHPTGDKLLGFTVRWPDKGYVVGPGSVVDGKTYRSNLAEILPFPEAWAREALAQAKKPTIHTTNGSNGLELPQRTAEGGRYAAIRTYQAQLYNRGLGRDAILTLVRTELAPTFSPGLSDAELLERFDRAWKDIELRLGDPRLPGRVDQVPQSTEGFDDDILEELKLGSFPADPEPATFGGYLGAAVEDLVKTTTASPVGLLTSLTAIAGAALATKTEFFGEQTSSFMALLVGESGTGKKGTAMDAAWRSLTAENVWGDEPVSQLSGLGSGEAIVGHMSRQAKYEGLARGIVWAPELSEVLIVGRREGSTLTTVLRNAFDRTALMNITKSATIAVPRESYQLGALAGVTPDELRSLLSAGTEMTNGFAGRWLSVPVVGRDDPSVDGGVAPVLRPALAEQFRYALEVRAGQRHRPILLEPDAKARLSGYYAFLSVLPGVSGVLARRYSTIAARVALVHSSLELDDTIPVVHVDRAIALTEYSRTGIPWVYGMSAVVSAKASRALQWLTTKGELTRSQLSLRMFGRRSDGRVDDAIEALVRAGLVKVTDGSTTTKGGRPPKVLHLTGLISSFERFTEGSVHAQLSVASRVRPREESAAVVVDVSTPPPDQSKPIPNLSTTSLDPVSDDTKPLTLDLDPGSPPWKSPCHYPADHGLSHIIRAGQAICLICDPDAERFVS